jgi:LysR family transcriptional activator of nhaA
VLSDQPVPTGLAIKAYNHRLGTSGLSFFAQKTGAAGLRNRFPASLDGARMLLPSRDSALRRHMDEWFEKNGLQPEIVGEFDDSALLKAFGEAGLGVFAGPTVIESEICRMYRTTVIGRAPEVSEHFYAISPERRLKHDAVVEITNIARTDLFANGEAP